MDVDSESTTSNSIFQLRRPRSMTGVADRQWAFEAHNSVARRREKNGLMGEKGGRLQQTTAPRNRTGRLERPWMHLRVENRWKERVGPLPENSRRMSNRKGDFVRTDSASSIDSYLDSPSAPQSIMSESGDEEPGQMSIPRAGAREPEPEPEIAFSREMEESPLMSQAIASNSFTHSLSTSTSPDPEYTTSTEVRIRSSSPVFDLYDVSDEERNRVRPSHPYNRRKENKRKFEAS